MGKYRLPVYCLTWLGFTGYGVWSLFSDVAQASASDPSAGAILGFLPFLIPIIAVYALAFTIPTLIVLELVLWFRRRGANVSDK